MLNSKNIIKYMKIPILTGYVNLEGIAKDYTKLFCMVNNESPLFNCNKIILLEKFVNLTFVGSGFFDLRDKPSINFCKSIKFIQINNEQFNRNEMKNLFWNNPLKFYYFSFISHNEYTKDFLKLIYEKVVNKNVKI